MSRSVMLLVVICTLFGLNCAARRGEEQSGGKDEGCVKNGKTYYPGEKFTIKGECNQYTCLENGATAAVTCALSRLPKDSPCRFSGVDLTKNYPRCCPQLICPPGQDP